MISVSFLKSNKEKKETIELIDKSICDLIHVDLMDGKYITINNFDIDEIIDLLKDTTKPLDIHLMVKEPEQYIHRLALLHPEIITIHIDSTNDLKEAINIIKDYNIKVGLAINPSDDIKIIDKYLDLIDYVLIMGVNPGLGGQKFMQEVIPKIKSLEDKNVLIGIDGGINNETIKLLKDYHIDIIVSGSYICMSDNYDAKIAELKKNKG